MTGRRGFTIIEVLATALMLSLLCMLGVQSIYRNLDTMSLDGAARQVYHAAQYARLLATESRRGCTLWIDLRQNRYWLEARPVESDPFADPASVTGSPPVTPDHPFARPRTLPVGVRFDTVRTTAATTLLADRAAIRFDPDGTADACLITMASEQDHCTVIVRPSTGKAELVFQRVDQLPDGAIDLNASGQTGDTVFRLW